MEAQTDVLHQINKCKYIKASSNKKRHCIVTKILLSVLIIYEQWYMELTGTTIPFLLQILALAIVLFTFFEIGNQVFDLIQNRTFICWTVFGIVSFIYSSTFGISDTTSTSGLITFFSFLGLCLCAGMVSIIENDSSWINTPIIIVSLLSAYCALTNGYERLNSNSIVISMSSFNNPNNLGLMMDIGIFATLFPKKKASIVSWVIRCAMTGLFFFVVLKTGSRSALIAAIIIIAFALFNFLRYTEGATSSKRAKRIIVIVIAIVACIYIVSYLQKNSTEGTSIYRLMNGFTQSQYSGRGNLYQKAWEYFTEHILFGLGYSCFSVKENGVFTHSTYMELLSCTGLIGFILFLYPVMTGITENIRNLKNDKGRKLSLLLMMIVSGLFGILYYNLVFMMLVYLTICDPKKMDQKGSLGDESVRN